MNIILYNPDDVLTVKLSWFVKIVVKVPASRFVYDQWEPGDWTNEIMSVYTNRWKTDEDLDLTVSVVILSCLSILLKINKVEMW